MTITFDDIDSDYLLDLLTCPLAGKPGHIFCDDTALTLPTGPIPQRGDLVRIAKGTAIHTTHPTKGPWYKAGTSYVVKVHSWSANYSHMPPSISWAGTGGYWCDAHQWEVVQW